jgi:uncharacterized protein YdeI (YjbR/CyaY-like superfamily)
LRGGPALAEGFIQHDGPGGGNIQRAHPSGHGNAHEVIAGAAYQVVEAGPFAAQHDDTVAGEVELIVVGGAAFVETNDPEVLLLEVFKGTNQVDDARDAEVFCGAGAGLDGGRAEGRRTAFGENHAIDPGAIGHSEQSTEVLGILDAIECQQEAGTGGSRRGLEEVFNREKFLRVGDGQDALVSRRTGKLGELLAGFLADADAGVAARGDEPEEARVLAFAGDHHLVEAAPSGPHGLLDRMQPVEDIHMDSVEGRTRAVLAGDHPTCGSGRGVDTACMPASKPPESKPKTFRAVLEPTGNALRWVIARVPFDPAEVWPVRRGRRVCGEINGFAFRTALFPETGGKKYVLLVNKKMQAGAGAKSGDRVTIRLQPDLEERETAIPAELARALKADRALRRYFDGLNPSMRRYVGDWVAEPKSAESRVNRAEQTAEWLFLAMDGERETPPILRVAFQRQSAARAGWEAMTPIRRRNHLLSIFHCQGAEAREKRVRSAVEDALKAARRLGSAARPGDCD